MGWETRLEDARNRVHAKFIRGGLKGISAWGDLVVDAARMNAPVDRGNLARSIHRKPAEVSQALDFSTVIAYGSEAPYAPAHELGSGLYGPSKQKYKIEAGYWTGKSDAKALAFHWADGPKPHPAYDEETDLYFFRSIMHPGIPAANEGKGIIRLALKTTHEEGVEIFNDALIAEFGR